MATREFWHMLGVGLIIFALTAGVGSCAYSIRLGDAAIEAAKHGGRQ